MVAKNETIGAILIKLAHRVGVVIIAFWVLEFAANKRVHLWTDFNLNHPVIMVVGLILAAFAVWRFLYWLSIYQKN